MNGAVLRVVHVLASLSASHGGPTRALLGLAQAQRAQGLDVRIVTGRDADMLWPEDADVPVRAQRRLPLPFELPGAALLGELARSIRAADVVHVHGLWNGCSSAALWLARRHRRIIVLSPHGHLDSVGLRRRARFKRAYRALIEDANLAGVDGFHFLDEAERAASRWHPAVAARPAVVVSNGVDVAGIHRQLSVADGMPVADEPGAVRLAYLGRLHPIKGLDLQLEVLADLRAAGQRAWLHLIGPDHGEAARLRERARTLGIAAHVRFHGAMHGAQRLAWLRDADAVLLTSFTEANSMTAAETFAAGGLLVATEGCALQRAAEAGAVTRVARERAALGDALRRLLADAAASRAQRAAAVHYARTRLDWSTLAPRLREFYAALAAARAGNAR